MRTRGFTLPELMAVIAILGIVVAVVLPAITVLSHADSDADSTRRTVQSSEFQCKGGFLFRVTSDGNATPATDAETRAPSAPRC